MTEFKWADVAHYYTKSPIGAMVNGVKSVVTSMDSDGSIYTDEPPSHGQGVTVYPESVESGEYTTILRHLEDMTEEEVKEMHMAFFKYEDVDYSGNKIKARAADIREHEGLVAATKIKKGYHFGKRAVTLYYEPCDGRAGEICEPLHGLERGVWLISRGFDVFGLIEAGEAIRKEVEK